MANFVQGKKFASYGLVSCADDMSSVLITQTVASAMRPILQMRCYDTRLAVARSTCLGAMGHPVTQER